MTLAGAQGGATFPVLAQALLAGQEVGGAARGQARLAGIAEQGVSRENLIRLMQEAIAVGDLDTVRALSGVIPTLQEQVPRLERVEAEGAVLFFDPTTGELVRRTEVPGLRRRGRVGERLIEVRDRGTRDIRFGLFDPETGEILDPTTREPIDAVPAGLGAERLGFTEATTLQTGFFRESKDPRLIAAAFGRVTASAEDPSAAGDLALIFNFMKMLDPGSVVREGEFANAQNAAGVPDRIRASYNKALRGERLSENTRADFVDRAQKIAIQTRNQFRPIIGNFRSQAIERGVNPDIFLDPFETFELDPVTTGIDIDVFPEN